MLCICHFVMIKHYGKSQHLNPLTTATIKCCYQNNNVFYDYLNQTLLPIKKKKQLIICTFFSEAIQSYQFQVMF